MKILIIGGGISDEREVSLRSAGEIYKAALKAGYEAEFYDWDGSSDWLGAHAKNFDVVLPILHGKGGEDGIIQRLLESLGVPFLGSTSTVAQECFDKQATRNKVKQLGFLVPEGSVMSFEEYRQNSLSGRPHVVKPVMGGSSIHTHIFKEVEQIDVDLVKTTFDVYDKLLVEQYIEGTEATVAVLEGYELPIVEIIPPKGKLFDYENKYNGATTELCPPEHVSDVLQADAQTLAQKVHQALGCRHLSRTDIIIREKHLYFLEINTIPGLTDQSLFPKAAQAAGLDFPELVDYFIKLVLNKV